MKIILGLFLCLSLISCNSIQQSQNSYPAQTPSNKARLAEGRKNVINQSKAQLAKGGIDLSVEGVDKDIMVFKSSSMSNFQMISELKNSFEIYRESGYREIRLTDSTGQTQTVDLTALDVK